MNHTQSRILFSTACAGLLVVAGCSSMPGSNTESGKDIATSGPTVLNARSSPGTIELNMQLQPTTPAEIIADVKDFNSNVTDVKLRFSHVPIEVPMQNVGGSTWRAVLSPRQLQLLAVSGRTMKYDANVIAKDDAGMTGISKDPVTVAVKTPEVGVSSG